MISAVGPQIGWLSDVAGIPLFLKGPGLKSHTLIVGQSGSGKSFMLGRLLEEIVLSSEAGILLLDPNADFVSSARSSSRCGSGTPLPFRRLKRQLRFETLLCVAELPHSAAHPNGASARDVYDAAAVALGLSDTDRAELLPSGVQTVYVRAPRAQMLVHREGGIRLRIGGHVRVSPSEAAARVDRYSCTEVADR